MNRKLVLVAVLAVATAACGGSQNQPPPGVPGGPGGIACNSAPPGAGTRMSDDLDLLLTVVKEPDWFSGGYSGWMSNQPLVPAQGTLELHTRRFNGSQTQVVMWGNFNIDPTIFFTNFFNWNQQPYNNPFPIYTVPHCFASVTATGQPQPGYWQAVVPGSQDKFLVGYTSD